MTSVVHVVKNPLNPFERDTYEHEGPIIDLLQDIAPEGFGMPIRVFVNAEEISLDDLDMRVANDDITAIIVTPGIGAMLASALISALVGMLVSVVMSLLFPPKQPAFGEKEENPTYSINTLRNQARLGQPVPVVYGDIWMTPDYASRPYRFFGNTSDNWTQYLDMLVCVGCGEYEEIQLDDLKIGNTTLSDTSAVQIKQFHLGAAKGNIYSHQGKFGQIQTQLWKDGWQGDSNSFVEAMYTSPEVGDWLFSDDTTTTKTTFAASVTWKKITAETGADSYVIEMVRADYDKVFGSGQRTLKISGSSLGNDGTYQIGFLWDKGNTSPTIDVPVFAYNKTITPGADTINVETEVRNNAMVAGPYWATPNDAIKTNYIYLDFEAQGGLYEMGSGGVGGIHATNNRQYWPKFKIEIYKPNGTLAMTYTREVTDCSTGSRTPIRLTFGVPVCDGDINGPRLPADRYQVKVTAVHKISDKDNIINDIKLTALKSNLNGYLGSTAYGDVTLLAVRMKATNGIAQQAQNQLRVRAKRVYPLLDGTTGVSSNPADVAHDILTNHDYGASQPNAKAGAGVFLHWDSFNDCRKLWEGYKTDAANYPAFNGVFSNSDVVFQALQSALSVAVAKPVMDQGQLKIVRDSIKAHRAFLFNASNIVLDSLTASYRLAAENDTDHVEVEYRDDDLMEPAFAIYPTAADLGRTPASPDKIKLFGCTNKAYAEKYARLIHNRQVYQRKTVSFETEMDGMLPTIGDRILVSSPQVRWGISGHVRFAKKNGPNWTLTLDAIPDWQSIKATGVTGWIVLTDKEGRVSNRVRILSTAAADEHVVLQADPVHDDDGSPFEIDLSGNRDPARFAILLSTGENGRDMEITSIEHSGGTAFAINAVHYEVAQNNTGHKLYDGVPDHMKKDYDGTDLI